MSRKESTYPCRIVIDAVRPDSELQAGLYPKLSFLKSNKLNKHVTVLKQKKRGYNQYL